MTTELDLARLPPRLSTPEVCKLARYSRATLWRRIDAKQMPEPVDRGGKGFLFDRDSVLKALGLAAPSMLPEAGHDWSNADAYRETVAATLRARQAARRPRS